MTSTRTNHGTSISLEATPPPAPAPAPQAPPPFHLATMDLLAIGHDPETYQAHRIKGREALKFWAWCAYGSLAEADEDHAADMAKELNDPDSWHVVDGQAVHFEVPVGEGGTVHFYLITES